MFERFESQFFPDATLSDAEAGIPVGSVEEPQLNSLLGRFAGRSFDRGVYRVLSPKVCALAKDFIAVAFAGYSRTTVPFACDWLGRVFALDRSRVEGGAPAVLMFEPGTGEALEIPCNLVTFHDTELIDFRDAALASDFYHLWLAHRGVMPRHDQCVGYKTPLFLGGKDEVGNLELSDLDVYWTLSGQLIQQARGISTGGM